MYTVIRAARINQTSLDKDERKDAAVPWNAAWIDSGMPISCCALSMAFVASPSDAPGARLKDKVTTGNCPWWLIASAVVRCSKWEKALNGTAEPLSPDVALGDAEPLEEFALGPVRPPPAEAP